MKTNKCFNISVSTIRKFMQITEFSAHVSQSVKEIPAAWRTGVQKQQTEENPAPPRVDWLCFLFTLISIVSLSLPRVQRLKREADNLRLSISGVKKTMNYSSNFPYVLIKNRKNFKLLFIEIRVHQIQTVEESHCFLLTYQRGVL